MIPTQTPVVESEYTPWKPTCCFGSGSEFHFQREVIPFLSPLEYETIKKTSVHFSSRGVPFFSAMKIEELNVKGVYIARKYTV